MNNIEAERARNLMTKGQLAVELGISTKTLKSYSTGVNPIPSNILIKMSKLFNCSVDYLLGLSVA